MKKILLIAFLLSVSISVYSKTLWQSTKTGMTVSQVNKIFPESKRLEPRPETTLGDGELNLLEIDAYKIGMYYYKVSFYFDDGKLSQVTIKLLDGQATSYAFDSLVEALRVKYGKEATSDDSGFIIEKRWITKEKTNIKLAVFGEKNLYLIYHVRDDLNTNKL